MKILSWNINGLGALAKGAQIKDLVRKVIPTLICVLETKLEVIDRFTLKSPGVRGDWSFSYVGSNGASGGILVAWDELCWISVDELIGNYSLFVVLQRVEDASKVVFTGVYGPSLRVENRRFWEELNVVRDWWVFGWCIDGDFNEIRFVCERSGCRRSTRNMIASNDFIAKHELVELPLARARFTWNRGESQSRIDRIFICPGWLNLVTDVYQRSLIHHCPILLDPRLESWGPPPFRFEIAWLQAPSMKERLGEWWSFVKSEGPLDVVIGCKLRFVKKKLREWVKEKRALDQNRK
ncbi:uncharacterized protein LOC143879008 [Tasmannia lanceolata]|uniref:uncharacterized protein LOC143879008 n=1 Tax=Tasmannia lanceolata TaxID=3420 RepID=UPI00406490CA